MYVQLIAPLVTNSVNGMFETAPDNRIRPERVTDFIVDIQREQTAKAAPWWSAPAGEGNRRGRRNPLAIGDGEGEQSVDEGSGIEQTSVGDVGVPPLQAALEVSLPFPLQILLSFSLLPDRYQFLVKWRVLFRRLSDDSSSLVCDSLGVSYPVMIRHSALFLSLPILCRCHFCLTRFRSCCFQDRSMAL